MILDDLYAWQDRFLAKYLTHTKRDFLLSGSPGCGKTTAAGKAIASDLSGRLSEKVCILAPSVKVCDQWQKNLAEDFGIQLLRDVDWKDYEFPRDYHGIVVTYACLVNNANWLRHFVNSYRTITVFDEIHHLDDECTWGETARNCFSGSQKCLALTGTPFRTLGQMPFITYNKKGLSEPDFEYHYRDAVHDGVCRRLSFPTVAGMMEWKRYEKLHRKELTDPSMTEDEMACALRTATFIPNWTDSDQTALRNSWMFKMLEASVAQLKYLRSAGRRPDSAALYVGIDHDHASRIKYILYKFWGIDAEFVHYKENDSHKKLERFQYSDRAALVSVNLVTEGVDIPRIRVIGWATTVSTETRSQQVWGRAKRPVRKMLDSFGNEVWVPDKGASDDHAWIFIPQVMPLAKYALKVMEDSEEGLKKREEKQPRPEGGPGPSPESPFKPISTVGRDGARIYNGIEYTVEQVQEAINDIEAHEGLFNRDGKEVERWLEWHHKRDDTFGVVVDKSQEPEEQQEIVDETGFVTNVNSSHLHKMAPTKTVPLEVQKKQLKKSCQEFAAKLANKMYPNEDQGPHIKRIHKTWAEMPGHHWQTDTKITVQELQEKSDWLQQCLAKVVSCD